MVEFKSDYQAKSPDQRGFVDYTEEENNTWKHLYSRQNLLLPNRACEEYIKGLEILGLTQDRVPQLPDVNENLFKATSWQVSPVNALITPNEFFNLLANRKFPAATFIRSKQEIDYVKEPDIFHELFGHCPMLTQAIFADFVQNYAQMVLQIDEQEWPLLQRLFWFTVEFGLVNVGGKDVRSYGGGILSSPKETVYAIESNIPERKNFDPVDVLRTPYRIDKMQTIYFVIDSFQELFGLIDHLDKVSSYLAIAHDLGEHEPSFSVEDGNPSIHINAC